MWDTASPASNSSVSGPWYADFPGWYWDMGIHGALALLLVVLIALAFVILLRSGRGIRDASALAILEERFARGEIRRGEYLERKRELS